MPSCEHLVTADNVQIYNSHLELGFCSYRSALYQVLTCNFLRALLAHKADLSITVARSPNKIRTKLLVIFFSLGEVGEQPDLVEAWPLTSLHLKNPPDSLIDSSGFSQWVHQPTQSLESASSFLVMLPQSCLHEQIESGP